MDEKITLTEGNIQDNQRRYENNRKNNRDLILKEKKWFMMILKRGMMK